MKKITEVANGIINLILGEDTPHAVDFVRQIRNSPFPLCSRFATPARNISPTARPGFLFAAVAAGCLESLLEGTAYGLRRSA